MGLVHARDREWASAETAFRRSIDINTNLSRTHATYAFWTLYQQGKLTQALDELQVALTLDPLSLDLRRRIAYVQLSAGQYAAAIDNCRYVLKADARFPLVGLVLARALLLMGKSDEAISMLEAMPPNRAPELGYAYASVGRRAEAEALAAAAAGVPATEAVIFAGLKDKDRTLAALERAAAIGDPKIGGTLTFPELAFLRDDPRFAAFARRIGVSPVGSSGPVVRASGFRGISTLPVSAFRPTRGPSKAGRYVRKTLKGLHYFRSDFSVATKARNTKNLRLRLVFSCFRGRSL